MNFNEFPFDRRIHAGITSIGYRTPTPIQSRAIPLILAGRDVLGVSHTGTGKTAAFVLPLLHRLLTGPRGRVRTLIIAPTRELAEQINQVVVALGSKTGLRTVSIYGGVSKRPQLTALRRGVEIVVACPGRLLDHMDAGAIDLTHVEALVLDEADRMCDMGFLPDVRRIISRLPTERQTLFFAATMPPDTRVLADRILRAPAMVQIGTIAPVGTVAHAIYPTSNERKKALLAALLDRTASGRVLVFTRTRYRARGLTLYLARQGRRVAALHGDMTQNQRQKAIGGFRDGRYDVLIATDIAARGIDITDISHVINYDVPDTVDAYIHRIGRTGRAHRTGVAYTLTTYADTLMIRSIERGLGAPIERRRLDGFDYGEFVPEHQFAPTPRRTAKVYRPRGRLRGRTAKATW